MVADALLLDRNEVAAHDHFAAPDFDAHAGRFERTASFEDGGNVVPQQREVCDFAARSESGRNRSEHSAATVRRHPIDGRFGNRLQRSFVFQGFDRLVGHAVAQDNDVFHMSYFKISNHSGLMNSVETDINRTSFSVTNPNRNPSCGSGAVKVPFSRFNVPPTVCHTRFALSDSVSFV